MPFFVLLSDWAVRCTRYEAEAARQVSPRRQHETLTIHHYIVAAAGAGRLVWPSITLFCLVRAAGRGLVVAAAGSAALTQVAAPISVRIFSAS